MNKQTMWVIGGVIAIVLVGAWISMMPQSSEAPTGTNTNNGTQSSGTTTNETLGGITVEITTSTASVSSSVGTGVVKEFTVTAQDYSFTPSKMTVKKGDKVRIIFKNVEGMHDFRIDEFGVAVKRTSGGSQETVEFTADKVGSFEYYCSIGTHRALGMKGTLTVQ